MRFVFIEGNQKHMADIYIVRQRIKGALQFTAGALLLAGFATWYFHSQMEFDSDRNRFVLSALISGALGIAWIGLFLFHIAAARIADPSNNFTNKFDNLPWFFLKIIVLLMIIGGVGAFILKNMDRTESDFDLLRDGNLMVLEQRLEENPAISSRVEKKGGMTLVQTAYRENYPEALALLLKNGASVIDLDAMGRNPVLVSLENPDMLKVLLEAGFSPEEADVEGNPPIHYAVAQNAAEILMILLESGAKVDARDGLFRTSLMRAVEADDEAMAQVLIEHGADLNAFDKRGDTVLHVAVRRKNPDMIRFLIEQGADPKIFNFVHMSALHIAALGGHDDLVKIFIEDPAMVDLHEKDGRAPLDYALKAHKYDTATLLIEAGADVNRVVDSGNTLLHDLLFARDYQTVRYLIRNGADARIPNAKGETAYDLMRRKELTGLMELVDESGDGSRDASESDAIQQ